MTPIAQWQSRLCRIATAGLALLRLAALFLPAQDKGSHRSDGRLAPLGGARRADIPAGARRRRAAAWADRTRPGTLVRGRDGDGGAAEYCRCRDAEPARPRSQPLLGRPPSALIGGSCHRCGRVVARARRVCRCRRGAGDDRRPRLLELAPAARRLGRPADRGPRGRSSQASRSTQRPGCRPGSNRSPPVWPMPRSVRRRPMSAASGPRPCCPRPSPFQVRRRATSPG